MIEELTYTTKTFRNNGVGNYLHYFLPSSALRTSHHFFAEQRAPQGAETVGLIH